MPIIAKLQLNLDRASAVALHRQLSDGLKQLILTGHLKGGEKVPGTRELALTLGIARITVSQAYDDLKSQGYLFVMPGSGTYISRSAGNQTLSCNPSSDVVEIAAVSRPAAARQCAFYSMGDGLAAPMLPLKLWMNVMKEVCESGEEKSGVEAQIQLKQVIAAYLKRARGLQCQASDIFLYADLKEALAAVSTVMLDDGDSVLFEEPALNHPAEFFVASSQSREATFAPPRQLQITPCAADENGLLPQAIEDRLDSPKIVYLSQSNYCRMTVPLPRRRELLLAARTAGATIVENDTDSYFQLSGSALPTMKSMDPDFVIYASSLEAILSPLSSLAFLVVPGRLRRAFEEEQSQSAPGASRFEQRVLSAFIAEGHFERHIWRCRKVFARRRQALIAALLPSFRQLSTPRSSIGTALLIRINTGLEEAKSVELAMACALPLLSTSAFAGVQAGVAGEFLVPLGWIAEQEISDRVKIFAELVSDARAQSFNAAPYWQAPANSIASALASSG